MTTVCELPLVEELTPAPDVASALRALQHLPSLLLFDSARPGTPTGRYSFLMADPFHVEVLPRVEFIGHGPAPPDRDSLDPLERLKRRLDAFPSNTVAGLPPFQGGAAGLLSYDLNRAWEKLPCPHRDEFGLPAMAVGMYDWVVAWDHAQNRAWIISQGFPETEPARRADRAAQRLGEVQQALRRRLASAAELRGNNN